MARASALALLPVFVHRPPLHARDGMIYQAGLQNSHLWNTKNKALALLSLWDGKTAVWRDHEGFAAVALGPRLKAVAAALRVGVGLQGGGGDGARGDEELFRTLKLSLTS